MVRSDKMKIRSYMKSRVDQVERVVQNGEVSIDQCAKRAKKFRVLVVLVMLSVVLPVFFVALSKQTTKISVVELEQASVVTLPIAATTSKKATLTIPSGTVKANPFLPYRDIGDLKGTSDVPGFALVEPPKITGASPEAVRVMDTIVSGILYDKYSPSAILNIEGSDYLVKKGDVVNNYKVLVIAQDSVTVQLGSNIYKAGIGEILTEGSLNHNDVSNLGNKFGGVR